MFKFKLIKGSLANFTKLGPEKNKPKFFRREQQSKKFSLENYHLNFVISKNSKGGKING